MPSDQHTDNLPGSAPDIRTWVDRYAAVLGVDAPTDDELQSLLALAGVAAHAAERAAAPVSCWIAAKAGIAPAEALDHARLLAEEYGS